MLCVFYGYNVLNFYKVINLLKIFCPKSIDFCPVLYII